MRKLYWPGISWACACISMILLSTDPVARITLGFATAGFLSIAWHQRDK